VTTNTVPDKKARYVKQLAMMAMSMQKNGIIETVLEITVTSSV
jgi:hypothetical protein